MGHKGSICYPARRKYVRGCAAFPQPKVPADPGQMATFAGVRTRTLRVNPGGRCVLWLTIISETLLLHDHVNFFWSRLAPNQSLGIGSSMVSRTFQQHRNPSDIKIQDTQGTPIRFNKNQPSTRHIIVNSQNNQARKESWKQQGKIKSLTYKGRQIRFAADLSTKTWQARKEWQDIFNVLNRKKNVAKNYLSTKAVIQNRRRD